MFDGYIKVNNVYSTFLQFSANVLTSSDTDLYSYDLDQQEALQNIWDPISLGHHPELLPETNINQNYKQYYIFPKVTAILM